MSFVTYARLGNMFIGLYISDRQKKNLWTTKIEFMDQKLEFMDHKNRINGPQKQNLWSTKQNLWTTKIEFMNHKNVVILI